MRKIVLFDLDGTILDGLSAENRFILHLLKNGHIGIKQWIDSFIYFFKWMPTFKKYIFVKNKAYLAGASVQQIEEMGKTFVQHHLLKHIRPLLVEKIEMHRKNGDHIILLTGAPDFLADIFAKHLNIEEVHASHFSKKDGEFTLLPPLQHPYADEKLSIAKNICKKNNAELSECIAYGNSIHDFSLLSHVGHPIAVTPDRRLRKKATKLNWDIIDLNAKPS